MEEYRSNSHKSREELKAAEAPEKKVEKVVSGPVKARKKSEIQKIADIFIQEDAQKLKAYILLDVLVPSLKKAIDDIVTNGTRMVLYGEHGRKTGASSKVSYRSYYDRNDERKERAVPERTRSGYEYDDIVLDSRGEAEEVLSRMDELIAAYGLVSVADFYDLVGVTGSYTDNKYGWTDIRSASVARVRDGYMIKLPRALPLN